MANCLINPLNPAFNPHNFPLIPNGIVRDHHHRHGGGGGDDIEMIAFPSGSYTSLKDVLPPSTPPPRDSWREIPIKDPLLKHAAWAYLQPMAVERGGGDRWWRRLRERCCGLFGCFNQVVVVVFAGWFSVEVD